MLLLPRAPSPSIGVPLQERDPTTLTPAEQIRVIEILQAERRAQNKTAQHPLAERETAQRESEQKDEQIKIKREYTEDDHDSPPRKKVARPRYTESKVKVEGGGSVRDPLTAPSRYRKSDIIVID